MGVKTVNILLQPEKLWYYQAPLELTAGGDRCYIIPWAQ